MSTLKVYNFEQDLLYDFRIILAVGGQNEVKRLDSVEAYDIATNEWTTKSPLPQALRCSTAVGHKGALYVFGGEKEVEIVKTAYRYVVYNDRCVALHNKHIVLALTHWGIKKWLPFFTNF